VKSSFIELLISASIGGLITGVIVPTLGEWLRGFFNGFHAARRRKKDKEKIINLLRFTEPEVTSKSTSTRGMNYNLYKRRDKEGYIYELLMELNREGRIGKVKVYVDGKLEEHWFYKHAEAKEVYF
jgi:hypothetical protein